MGCLPGEGGSAARGGQRRCRAPGEGRLLKSPGPSLPLLLSAVFFFVCVCEREARDDCEEELIVIFADDDDGRTPAGNLQLIATIREEREIPIAKRGTRAASDRRR